MLQVLTTTQKESNIIHEDRETGAGAAGSPAPDEKAAAPPGKQGQEKNRKSKGEEKWRKGLY